LTVALALPHPTGFATMRAEVVYRKIHEAFLQAIRSSAPGACLALKEDCRPGAACFESPALSDILCDGRKICGGALRRGKIGILYQGSLHVDVSPPVLAESLASSVRVFFPSSAFEECAAHLEREKYSSDAWTRMR
jgi:lipoate-protein ligase A